MHTINKRKNAESGPIGCGVCCYLLCRKAKKKKNNVLLCSKKTILKLPGERSHGFNRMGNIGSVTTKQGLCSANVSNMLGFHKGFLQWPVSTYTVHVGMSALLC